MTAPDKPPYRRFSAYLKETFGAAVRRVCVNPGFSCPNLDGTLSTTGCIYCNNRAFSPAADDTRPLQEQIASGIALARRRYGVNRFFIYFQPYSSTYGPASLLRQACETVLRFPGVVGLAVGTRPDCVDDEKLDILASYLDRLDIWVEYGLQSIHDKTLRAINRNHTCEQFLTAFASARARGLKICCHLILGLPGEEAEEMIETARKVGQLEPDGVKIHPLYIATGTTLEEWYRNGLYTPMAMTFYAEMACRVLEWLPPGTVIHRLTADCPAEMLVAPDWIRNKDAVLAGVAAAFGRRRTRQGSALGKHPCR